MAGYLKHASFKYSFLKAMYSIYTSKIGENGENWRDIWFSYLNTNKKDGCRIEW